MLVPGRAYDAALFALDATLPGPAVAPWSTLQPLYQFTFRTSRWATLADHLAATVAHGALDEIGLGEGLAALSERLGSASRLVDDVALAAALADLGLPPRDPPEQPELVRIWETGSGGERLLGLLIDGPEPLPRPEGGSLELRTPSDARIPSAIIQGQSGARTLVLFRQGADGLTGMTPAPLRIEVRDDWIDAQGVAQTDSAVLDLAVPPRPAFLEPDAPP